MRGLAASPTGEDLVVAAADAVLRHSGFEGHQAWPTGSSWERSAGSCLGPYA
jgi:hypothetical protein